MNILITKKPISQLGSQFANRSFLFEFSSSIHPKNPFFIQFPARKCYCARKTTTICCAAASESLDSFGGWDHPQQGSKAVHSGESNLLRSFLISLGIDDKKYAFVYILGFVCALALFRIKVSSIIAFPACAVVFATGFSIGFVNGGRMSLSETNKRPKDEFLEGCIEILRNLVDLLSAFDVQVMSLKNDIKKCTQRNQITLDDLGSFLKTVESINKSSLEAKNLVQGCMEGILVENQEMEKKFNIKSSKRKKDGGEIGLSFVQSISEFFGMNSKPSKMKDLGKRELINMEVNGGKQGNILSSLVEERSSNSVLDATSQDRAENMIKGDIRMNNQKMFVAERDGSGAKAIPKSDDYSYKKRSLFSKDQEVSWKMSDHTREVETWASSYDGLLNSMDFSVSIKHRKTETSSFRQNQTMEDFDCTEETEHNAYGFMKEGRAIPDTEPSRVDHESTVALEDMEFNRCLTEANILLKEAKECLMQQGDHGVTESALYNAARLLLKATGIRPMSLLAVGQLGNTYLLHGELKLRLSRELRNLLARNDIMLMDNRDDVDDQVGKRDKITSVLVRACEDCEDLLVKAGRKYRLALSIDGNDMRALYNWGLALFFRAQLIADIGPAAARDADKIYLAAIDKFDAMMSKSNLYAPDALFRWGAALQQRSRLRPRNSKEKVKLLQQARRLYEDALDMDSDNDQVRNALSSCVSELKYWYD